MEERCLLAATVITVTSNADSGGGTLREALTLAEDGTAFGGTFGQYIIDFNIPTAGGGANTLQTISLASALPVLDHTFNPTLSIVIDGTSQLGGTSPGIELTRSGAWTGPGLDLRCGASTITGLIINGFGGDGIDSSEFGGNTFTNNWIGTTNTGNAAKANTGNGINLSGVQDGTDTFQLVTVSPPFGHSTDTFRLSLTYNSTNYTTGDISFNSTTATVQAALNAVLGANSVTVGSGFGNEGWVVTFTGGIFKGHNIPAMTASVTAGTGSVDVVAGAPQTTIGGLATTTGSAPGNVISGNTGDGIHMQIVNGEQAQTTFIEGNLIGLGLTGGKVANAGSGISIFSNMPNNVIGGNNTTSPGVRNVISGNGLDGITLQSTGNTVQGNFIGTNITGTIAIGNSGNGLDISSNNATGVTTNIGGLATTPGTGVGNLISGNVHDGIFIGNGNYVQVQGNLIGTNLAGTAALPNGTANPIGTANTPTPYGGIALLDSGFNTIGATAAETVGSGYRNIISGNSGFGIQLMTDSGAGKPDNTAINLIRDNYIGLNATGTAALPNTNTTIVHTGNGIELVAFGISSGGNTSGDPLGDVVTNTIDSNVISGNAGDGILMWGNGNTQVGGTGSNVLAPGPAQPSSNTVINNKIGTDPNGSGASGFGNGGDGVYLRDRVTSNLIGTTTVGNIISDNTNNGVEIATPSAQSAVGNDILSNKIGTDSTGTLALGNHLNGVVLSAATGNIISNSVGLANAGNIIAASKGSGVNGDGVLLSGVAVNGNTVVGNFIGTNNATATVNLGNAGSGVRVDSSASNTSIGTINTGGAVSTAAAGEGNTIAYNQSANGGVFVTGGATNTVILSSYRTASFVSGEVAYTGNTGNDINNGKAGPTLLAASSSTGGTTGLRIAYTLTGLPTGSYTIQFFDNGSSSASNKGQTFLGQQTITGWTLGSTNIYAMTGLPTMPFGDYITATATLAGGSTTPFTSQFATPIQIGAADLVVTKVAVGGPFHPGDQITYTIVLHNNPLIVTTANLGNVTIGDDPVGAGAVVSDPLPNNSTFVTIPTGGTPTGWTPSTPVVGNTGTVSWTSTAAGTLGAGLQVTFTFTLQSLPSAPSNFQNVVTATAPSNIKDPVTSNNTFTATNTLTAQADLSVTKTGPSNATAGDPNPITYTLLVTNNGISDAQTVSLTDTLPAGLTFVSQSQSGTANFTLGNSGNAVTDTISTFAANTSTTILIVATVNSSVANNTVLVNSASITSPTTDLTPANNSSTISTTVTTQADLAVVKTGPAAVNPGANITYTITVTNNGPSDAQTLSLTDTVPAGSTFVSFALPNGWTRTDSTPVGGTGILTATRPALASGANGVFTLVVHTPSNAPTNSKIVNVATINAATTDPTPTNNNSTVTTTINSAVADLSIVKSGPATTIAGDPANLLYTLTVTNNGPSDAQSVTLTDTLPGAVTFVSATDPVGWTGPTGTGPVSWTISTLTAGSTATFVVTVHVASSVADGSLLVNSASITSTTPDSTMTNNSSTVTTTVQARADLKVVKTGPVTAIAGDPSNLTYTITVSNSGPSDAQSVALSDTLPSGTAFVSQSQSGSAVFTLSNNGNSINDTLSTMVAGSSAIIKVIVHVGASVADGTVLANAAKATSTTTDPVAGNNTATATTTINARADLSVVKSAPSVAPAGVNFTYTISVTNNGPSDAQSVTLTDTLPTSSISYVAGSASQPAGWSAPVVTASTITWTKGTLAAGSGTVVFTFVVGVTLGTPNGVLLINKASVTSTTTDPTPGNNSSTVTTTVNSASHLVVTKTTNLDPVPAGTDLTFTITVANQGPSPAGNLTVTDPLPAHTTFVSFTADANWSVSTPNQGSNGTLIAIWVGNNGFMPVTTSAISVVVHVDPSTTTGTVLTNNATAVSSTIDPSPGSNTGSVNVTVTDVADLAITKTDGQTAAVPGQTVTYTIVVSNNGPSIGGGTVSDFFPDILQNVAWSASISNGATVGAGGGTGPLNTTVQVLPGATVPFTVSGTLASVTILAGFVDSDLSNNTATDSDRLRKPDLMITGSDVGSLPEVKVYNAQTGALKLDFFAYDASVTGGVRVAIADVNGDGVPDIVTAPGPGAAPQIKVFDGTNSALLFNFFAYTPSFTGGVFVAAGDVNADGAADIVTGPDVGGMPEVKVFGGGAYSGQLLRDYFAYSTSFLGGVRVAVGDVNGDNFGDVITGAGPGGPPEVKVFSGRGTTLLKDFFAYNLAFSGGVYVAGGDVNGDGWADVITGPGTGLAEVKAFDGTSTALIRDFLAFPPTMNGLVTQVLDSNAWNSGARVGAADLNGDGFVDILAAPGPIPSPEVKGFDALTLKTVDDFFAYDGGYRGGVFISGGH